jgi:hypothetical protein
VSTYRQYTFPPELLRATKAQRLAYFQAHTSDHAKLKQAARELWQAIYYGGDRHIIHLYGCTGVGKSTLRRRIERVVTRGARTEMQRDPDLIPIASVTIPPPIQAAFNWRDVYLQTLDALGQPPALVAKLEPKRLQFQPHEGVAPAPKVPRQELRLKMAASLQRRRVKVLVYDEAQHFQRVTMAQHFQNQMDNLKWLAEVTGTTIVLIGTYDLLNLVDRSGQLARRSTCIHFSRYHADDEQEWREFCTTVKSFQVHLPLAETPKLVECADYLYERTFGCIGLLKEWLLGALVKVIDENETTLTEAHLEACVDYPKLVAVGKEAVHGDQRALKRDNLRDELDTVLKSASALPLLNDETEEPPPAPRSRTKPGQRNAKRDPVGPGLREAV